MTVQTKTKIVKIALFLSLLSAFVPVKISLKGNGINTELGISLSSANAAPNGFNICTANPNDPAHNLSNCINNIYVFSIGLGGFIAVFMFVWAGYMYITGGDERISKAKSIFGSTIAGLLLLFGVYAILNTINPSLTQLNGVILPQVNCTNDPKTGDYGCQILYPTGPVIGLQGGPGSGGTGGASACVNQEHGSCTKAVISACPAMAANMDNALKACNQESAGGIPLIPSGVDKCTETTTGQVVSFSWGLWQLNVAAGSTQPEFSECAGVLTQAGGPWKQLCVDGSTCGRTCTFGSGGLVAFQGCVKALGSPERNTKQACTLYQNSGGWGPWPYTRKVCGLP